MRGFEGLSRFEDGSEGLSKFEDGEVHGAYLCPRHGKAEAGRGLSSLGRGEVRNRFRHFTITPFHHFTRFPMSGSVLTLVGYGCLTASLHLLGPIVLW